MAVLQAGKVDLTGFAAWPLLFEIVSLMHAPIKTLRHFASKPG
jgi:hypothetical protein